MDKGPTASDFIRELYRIWITERPTQLATTLAYYGMFSLAPAIFITSSIVGLFLDELSIANQIYELIDATLGSEITQMVQEALIDTAETSSSNTIIGSIISFIVLLAAASGAFFQLHFSLNTIWKVPPPQKDETQAVIRQRLFAFLMVISLSLVTIILVFVNFMLSMITSLFDISDVIPSMNIITALIFVFLTLAFFTSSSPMWKLPGAMFGSAQHSRHC
ncbi:MAG: hypothetical protein GTO18_02390 [Anaerolineales bacterium]|nr:hypothetical protein [Anaerolineales bacterium]